MSPSVENSLWKRPWTCSKAEYVMTVMMMTIIIIIIIIIIILYLFRSFQRILNLISISSNY
jgi:cell division protein FtsL